MTERLNTGCFFIGTTIDSDELLYRVRSNPENNNSIKNKFHEVILPQDSFLKNKSPFGHKYYFYLKEAIGKETKVQDTRPKLVDEFLVIFEVLEKMAFEYGLKLVMKKNFRQYFDDMCSSNPHSMEMDKE